MDTFTLLTDRRDAPPEKTQAIGELILELMAFAKPKASGELVLNAVLGAYINLAREDDSVSFEKCMQGLIRTGQTLLNLEAQTQRPVSPEAAAKATAELATRLTALLVDQQHEVAIGALLSLFRSLAMRFECCTEGAAFAAADVAGQLTAYAHASKTTPAGPVH